MLIAVFITEMVILHKYVYLFIYLFIYLTVFWQVDMSNYMLAWQASIHPLLNVAISVPF